MSFDLSVDDLHLVVDAFDYWLVGCPFGETVWRVDEVEVKAHARCDWCKGTGYLPDPEKMKQLQDKQAAWSWDIMAGDET